MRKIYTLLLMVFWLGAKSQYIPLYSQYVFAESVYNPAYFGMDKALSISALHRSHWMKINGGPKTTFLTAQFPLWNILGLGLGIISDDIGPLNNQTVQGGLSYHLNMSDNAKLSLGLMAGLQGLKMNWDKINLQNASDPSFLNLKQRYFYPVIGYGIYFKNRNLNVGISVPQIGLSNNLDLAFGTHYLGKIGYNYGLGNNLKFSTSLLGKFVKGSPFELDVNQLITFKNKFWVGFSYRSFAVVSAMAGIHLTPQIKIGVSYDYPLTILNEYTIGNSEFLLNYTMYDDQPKVITPRFF